MLKQTVKIDTNMSKKLNQAFRDEHAVQSAIIAEVFVYLLHDTPQFSGNFVANMALQVGGSRGQKGGMFYFDKHADVTKAFSRGSLAAINKARELNKGFQERMIRSLLSGRQGINPKVTLYNNLPTAETIENLDFNDLRRVNRAGANPMYKADRMLKARFAKPLKAGSPEWERLRKLRIL